MSQRLGVIGRLHGSSSRNCPPVWCSDRSRQEDNAEVAFWEGFTVNGSLALLRKLGDLVLQSWLGKAKVRWDLTS